MQEIINYITADFSFSVSCNHISELYYKAQTRISDIKKSTSYKFEGTPGSFLIWSPESKSLEQVNPSDPLHPIFFENTEYFFEIAFNSEVNKAFIKTPLRSLSEKFNSPKKSVVRIITGSINFGNDIGSFNLSIQYEKYGSPNNFSFQFEIFTTKLDYKRDHRILVMEIEDEYLHLSLDLLKKTYFGFKSTVGEGNDLTWYQLFGALFKDITSSIKFILSRPHSQLIVSEQLLKREKLKRITPSLKREVMLHRLDSSRLYAVESKLLSHDTVENQFLKHAITYTQQKFLRIIKIIKEDKKNVPSKEHIEELEEIGLQLKTFSRHPLFKTISDYTGMSQESSVLQRKVGYSSIYRNWILLRRGIQLFEEIHRIELKNIADLYQYWCFLKIKKILQSFQGVRIVKTDFADPGKDNFLFKLKRGQSPGVTFITENGETIELYHEYMFEKRTHSKQTIGVLTQEQRPDITLRIIKKEPFESYTFTFLYDAKYRVEMDDLNNSHPPVDAISQMHRYRDSIYRFSERGVVGREVVGGFIIYPGVNPPNTTEKHSAIDPTEEISLGSFCLSPGIRDEMDSPLAKHLQEIVFSDSHTLFKKILPHTQMNYEETDPTILIVHPTNSMYQELVYSENSWHYFVPFLSSEGAPYSLPLNGLIKYFALAQNNISSYYKIDEICVRSHSEILALLPVNSQSSMQEKETSFYFVFTLSQQKQLANPIQIPPGPHPNFMVDRLSQLTRKYT